MSSGSAEKPVGRVEKVIKAMKENALLWDTTLPGYRTAPRKMLLRKCSRRIGISEDRMGHIITYVKKRYCQQVRMKGKTKFKLYWKWYRECSFLKGIEVITPKYLLPALELSQIQAQEADSSVITPPLPAESTEATSEDVFVMNPDFEVVASDDDCSSGGKISDKGEDDAEENSKVMPAMEDDNKFLISGICSTITHHLSNANCSDEDVVDFHGDLLKFMYRSIK